MVPEHKTPSSISLVHDCGRPINVTGNEVVSTECFSSTCCPCFKVRPRLLLIPSAAKSLTFVSKWMSRKDKPLTLRFLHLLTNVSDLAADGMSSKRGLVARQLSCWLHQLLHAAHQNVLQFWQQLLATPVCGGEINNTTKGACTQAVSCSRICGEVHREVPPAVE